MQITAPSTTITRATSPHGEQSLEIRVEGAPGRHREPAVDPPGRVHERDDLLAAREQGLWRRRRPVLGRMVDVVRDERPTGPVGQAHPHGSVVVLLDGLHRRRRPLEHRPLQGRLRHRVGQREQQPAQEQGEEQDPGRTSSEQPAWHLQQDADVDRGPSEAPPVRERPWVPTGRLGVDLRLPQQPEPPGVECQSEGHAQEDSRRPGPGGRVGGHARKRFRSSAIRVSTWSVVAALSDGPPQRRRRSAWTWEWGMPWMRAY